MTSPMGDMTPVGYQAARVTLAERLLKRPIRRYLYPVLNVAADAALRLTITRGSGLPVDLWMWGQRGNDYARHRRRLSQIRTLGGADVLIAGCGTGRDVESWLPFHPRRILGVDYFRYDSAWDQLGRRAHRWQGNTTLEFAQGDLTDLSSIPSGSFDIVGSDALLEHVRDVPRVLCEFYRVLREQGVLYATFGPLWFTYHGDHVSGYDRREHGFNHLLLGAAAYQDYLAGYGPYQHSEDDGRTWTLNGMFSFLRPIEYLEAVDRAGFKRRYVAAMLDPCAHSVIRRNTALRMQLLAIVRDPLDLLVASMTIIARKT